MLDEQMKQAILTRVSRIPIVDTLRMSFDEFDEGYCKATMPRQACYDGVYQSLHGGLLMTLADSIACFAIMTRTGPDETLTTTDMNIRFLAPCLTDVTAIASVIKLGRTLCPVSVDLADARGRKVAVAQVTYIRLPREPAHSKTRA